MTVPINFRDACFYCEAMERKMATPSLFDLLDTTEGENQKEGQECLATK